MKNPENLWPEKMYSVEKFHVSFFGVARRQTPEFTCRVLGF